ncbi:ATP-binding cassette, subfamily B (MDR/TAP), member 6 [Paragonimus westermani]|uniref:ATP-binding cassette, subfamily B (MDR/TAP), member 6 n=1 Tax=Paragonimus westermani TaxID=34504 RepID=A0A5J4NKS5_9TREM|nr:ATP-binding cassette, subfamily B (MDR/TAP), member 6 [Paragonimus westermani]
MLAFCPKNQSVYIPWANGGLNPCFTGTLSSAVLALFVIPFLWNIIYLRRYGRRISQELQSNPKLLYSHIFLSIAALSANIVYLFVAALTHSSGKNEFHGYLINELVLKSTSWTLSVFALFRECVYVLRVPRVKRHSCFLLLFWTIAVITSFLPLLSLKNNDWWWQLDSSKAIAQFSLWILHLVCVVGTLVFGIVAPGLPKDYMAVYNYLTLNTNDGTSEVLRTSSWRRGLERLKLLTPYIWPRSDRLIQLRVVFCAVLLVLDRVVNLYSPIFYKQIGQFCVLTICPIQILTAVRPP